MNRMLDQETLAAYRRRWQVVAEFEAAERRTVSPAERWQQMNALLRLALALELPLAGDNQEADEVRRRWNRLRTLYLDKVNQTGSNE